MLGRRAPRLIEPDPRVAPLHAVHPQPRVCCPVALQRADGIAFVPADDVALAFPEALPPPLGGRTTVVLRDGRVLHRPPLDFPAPLVALGDGVFVHPGHARKLAGKWGLQLPARLPKPLPAPRAPSDVVYVKGATATTLAGPRRITENEKQFLVADPAFAAAGPYLVNVACLRGLTVQQRLVRLDLAPATKLLVSPDAARALAATLGLDDLAWLHPLTDLHKAMYRLGVRDFPFVLLQAPADALREAFADDLHAVVVNLVWEAFRRRGQDLGYGTDLRGFWYRPVLPVITRMGLRRETVSALAFLGMLDFKDPQYMLVGRVFNEIVGEERLLTYHDLGFSDPRPQLRTVGNRRPAWLLAAEKNSLLTYTRQLGEKFGISTVLLGGMPHYEDMEFLAEDLRPHLQGTALQVVSYGDYDDAGWVIADAVVAQLARYGIDARLAGRLVRPERFTKEEIRLYAEPIPQIDAMRRTRVQDWLARSGGIGGKARGMHADHLLPLDRVLRAFQEETGLEP